MASSPDPYSLLDRAPGHAAAAPYLPDLQPALQECHLSLPAGLARARLAHRHFDERRQQKLDEVGVLRELENRRRTEFQNYRTWFNLRSRPAYLRAAGSLETPQGAGMSPVPAGTGGSGGRGGGMETHEGSPRFSSGARESAVAAAAAAARSPIFAERRREGAGGATPGTARSAKPWR